MNQDIQFIQTKINLPQLRANHLKRPRLLEKLNNVYDYRLVTVTAPAGFGKTTFLTAWVNAAGLNRKTAFSWLSLDEYDNEPEFFWTYFLMSFHKTVEPICQILKNVSLFQNQNSIYKAGISFLINEISNMNSEFVAVLDDFHVISDASILEGMKFLIRNMPPNMHVVISGRSMPELGTARLRAADSLMEFKKEDLSFTSEESNEFISDVMGLSFDKGKTALLNQETEGWAAGLQMAALSIKNSKAEDINGILNSSKRFAFDYIAEEVFCGLEENIKKFLMYTSILDEFSAKICDYILETSGSSRFINQIESQNLFVSALDNEKNWFCYHNLFRNFLRTRLECENMCITKKLYIRASEWYENQNLMNKAINFSIKGCNYDNAVRMIEKISPDILCRGEAKLLHKWNGSLPNEVVLNNPRLLINSAWGVYSDGKTGEIETYTEAARKLLSGCTDEKSMEQMKAEITALSVNISEDVKYQDSIVDDCRYALKHLDENEFLTQLIIFNMANAYLLKGNLPEAIKLFEKCLDSSIRVGNYYIAIISNKALSTSRKWYGQYNEAEENCLMLINALKQYHVEVFSTSGILYAELADLYYQRNDLDKALENAEKGLELGEMGDNLWVLAESSLMLSKIYDAMGLDAKCLDALNIADTTISDGKFFDTRINLENTRAEISLRKGDYGPAINWLERTDSIPENIIAMIYPSVYLLRVRLKMFRNEFSEALDMLQALYTQADKYNLKGLIVHILVLRAMLYDKMGNESEADKNIERAISLIYKQDIARVFLNEGKHAQKLLKRVRKRIANEADLASYLDRLLNAFECNAAEKKHTVINEILSRREIEVLQLLDQGAANLEISEKLFISLNTVKTHLLNIYSKLDVHNRTGALVKARDLKLMKY